MSAPNVDVRAVMKDAANALAVYRQSFGKDAGIAEELDRACAAVTRDEYLFRRACERRAAGHRIDRALPHHPDGTGLAPCAYCNGQGVVERHHWNPQLDKSWPCPECGGMGDIPDGWRDPLLRLRYYRQRRVRRRNPAGYQHMRRVCATPVWQLRLIESAVGCDLAARRAVAAWREVA